MELRGGSVIDHLDRQALVGHRRSFAPSFPVAGRRVVVAWAIGVPLAGLLVVGTLASIALGDAATTSTALPLAGVSSLVMGMALMARLPSNRIGWLLWVDGCMTAATVLGQGLATLGLTTHPGSVPGAEWLAVIGATAGAPALFLPVMLLPMLYPTGRPLTARWRPLVALSLVVLGAWSIGAMVGPFAPGDYPAGVRNPLELGGALVGVPGWVQSVVLGPALAGVMLSGFASLLIRFRRAHGIERQQLKWFTWTGAVGVVALMLAGAAQGQGNDWLAVFDNLAWLAAICSLIVFPLAIGTAVMRYGLYEIDRLISRTISYSAISLALLATFAVSVLVLGVVLAPITSSNELAVAGSTLLIAALFQPLRTRLQRLVDRRFNRASYDGERTLAALAGRLRDELDADTVRALILDTIDSALEPVTVQLWIR